MKQNVAQKRGKRNLKQRQRHQELVLAYRTMLLKLRQKKTAAKIQPAVVEA